MYQTEEQLESFIQVAETTVPTTEAVGSLALGSEVQFRGEHSISIEDAEKYKALSELQRIGVLLPLAETDTYHGRVSLNDEGKDWRVDPDFRNGSNESGNRNVNNRPTLYTSGESVAKEFGNARAVDIFEKRLREKIGEEVDALGPKYVRQSQMEKDVDRIKAMFDGFTDEQKNAWLDIENYPTAIPGYSYINRDGREAFMQYHAHGELPEADDAPFTPRERHIAVLDREHDLSEEERDKYIDGLTSDLKLDIHDIVSNDPEAKIINNDFNYNELSDEDKQTYAVAISRLIKTLPVTQAMPLPFGNTERVGETFKALVAIRTQKAETHGVSARLTKTDVERVITDIGSNLDLTNQLAASANAQFKIFGGLKPAAHFLLSHTQNIAPESHRTPDVHVSTEYIARFMREMHIVGEKSVISSATLGKDIDAISLFDLSRVNVDSHYRKMRQLAGEEFGDFTNKLAAPFEGLAQDQAPLLATLRNAHAKPQEIIAAAKQVGDFAKVFEADAGNWEQFSLEEHTETVLRNFDENFADVMPVELLAPIRLAIVVHDIGKPTAAAEGKKHRQTESNAMKAEEYMDTLDIDKSVSGFIGGLIGTGMELATQTAVFGRDQYLPQMRSYAARELESLLGKSVDEGAIDGYLDLAEILVTCNGGAYTTMAVTRRPGVAAFRNAGSFDDSFKDPSRLDRRDLALRNGGIAGRSKKQL